LSEIRVGEGESIETALKRFKKKIQREGILSEIKRRERYEKRKRKSEAARKRRAKSVR
jgi:small subunit ribosomal protein S21